MCSVKQEQSLSSVQIREQSKLAALYANPYMSSRDKLSHVLLNVHCTCMCYNVCVSCITTW